MGYEGWTKPGWFVRQGRVSSRLHRFLRKPGPWVGGLGLWRSQRALGEKIVFLPLSFLMLETCLVCWVRKTLSSLHVAATSRCDCVYACGWERWGVHGGSECSVKITRGGSLHFPAWKRNETHMETSPSRKVSWPKKLFRWCSDSYCKLLRNAAKMAKTLSPKLALTLPSKSTLIHVPSIKYNTIVINLIPFAPTIACLCWVDPHQCIQVVEFQECFIPACNCHVSACAYMFVCKCREQVHISVLLSTHFSWVSELEVKEKVIWYFYAYLEKKSRMVELPSVLLSLMLKATGFGQTMIVQNSNYILEETIKQRSAACHTNQMLLQYL